MSNQGQKPRLDGFSLTYLLALIPPVGYWIVWYLLGRGDDGCGPGRNTTAAGVFEVVAFGLPIAVALIAVRFGMTRRWRTTGLVGAASIIILVGGTFEVLVFLTEFGLHHCGE